MPRHADPDLERRILDAAQKLWKKGGEKALTMRAVARAARTTTPTVYQRFSSRSDILRAILYRIQQDFLQLVESSQSAEALAEGYIDFALGHALEFELFFAHQNELFQQARRGRVPVNKEPRPAVVAARSKMAEWMGGSPEDYVELHWALWALTHGTAMLLTSKSARDEASTQLRKATKQAIATLLREMAPHARTFRS